MEKKHNRVFINVAQSDLEILARHHEIRIDASGRTHGLGDLISRYARRLEAKHDRP